MSRPKAMRPKLYQRGRNGNYCFRRRIDGSDREFNTGTNIKLDAEKCRDRIIESEFVASAELRQGEVAQKVSQVIIKNITGAPCKRITFEEGWKIYIDITENYEDLSEGYRKRCSSVYGKFSKWAIEQGLAHLDEISIRYAKLYANLFWKSNAAPKTFDDHIKVLSKIFSTIDAVENLVNRNPFNSKAVPRKQKGLIPEASRLPLEPEMITAVMVQAARKGKDWYDLFMVGLHTGMRLKDAALLRWDSIDEDMGFIDFVPHKTRKYKIGARFPITEALRNMLRQREKNKPESPYVNPVIADYHLRSDWVIKKSQDIFNNALGRENIIIKPGPHRKVNSSVYSFESFRTTMASLLARNNTEYRDVMNMLGWNSWDMLKIYEKKFKFASQERDARTRNIINNLKDITLPLQGITVAPPEEPFRPTKNVLEELIQKYSNITIGKIYGITEAAVRKWLKVLGVSRTGRINSADISDEEIQKIREGLRTAA